MSEADMKGEVAGRICNGLIDQIQIIVINELMFLCRFLESH